MRIKRTEGPRINANVVNFLIREAYERGGVPEAVVVGVGVTPGQIKFREIEP